MNNYWHTNFPRVQSGDFTVRYLLTSATELSSAVLSRLGREALTPLEVGQLTSSGKVGMRGSLPVRDASFLVIDGEGVELETVKPAEDGRGNVLRLLETSGGPHIIRLRGGFVSDRAALGDRRSGKRPSRDRDVGRELRRRAAGIRHRYSARDAARKRSETRQRRCAWNM